MDYVIGDTQSKAGVKNPLIVIAHHICDMKPKHVIHLGDHWDLPSLGMYEKGTRKHTINASYLKDMDAGNKAMREFWEILDKRWLKHTQDCVFILITGNHEHRRERALQHCAPEFHELIEQKEFDVRGWDMVIPFLEIIRINGVEYCHYFSQEGSGKAISSARLMLNKRHVSCIAGHKQGFDYAEQIRGKDERIQSIICGSSYYHDEDYKNHTNHHARCVLVVKHLPDKKKGFDFMTLSLDLLDRMYG